MERHFEVTDKDSLYFMMVGRIISESENAVILEFNQQNFDSLKQIQFSSHQVKYFGYY